MKNKELQRLRRKKYIRKRISGTSEKPRVYVHKTNRYVYVGVADDSTHKVYGSVRLDKGSDSVKKGLGDFVKILNENKIETVVFDRSGYKYHGVVATIADGLRESGINL